MTKTIARKDVEEYIGYQSEPTEWFTVTQDQIDEFAECTHDQQFIHVDPEKAKDTPFGSTIAHGFLTLSMLSHFAASFSVIIEGLFMGVNYGFDNVRFLAPVKVNSRIRAVPRIMDVVEKKPGQYLIKTEVVIEIEGEDKPALIAEWLNVQMVA
jgi:acyl dehydratase